jgi:hypothetical protein
MKPVEQGGMRGMKHFLALSLGAIFLFKQAPHNPIGLFGKLKMGFFQRVAFFVVHKTTPFHPLANTNPADHWQERIPRSVIIILSNFIEATRSDWFNDGELFAVDFHL